MNISAASLALRRGLDAELLSSPGHFGKVSFETFVNRFANPLILGRGQSPCKRASSGKPSSWASVKG